MRTFDDREQGRVRLSVRQRAKQALHHTEVAIEIDGVRHPGVWGVQDFEMPSGEHRVAVSFRYCRGARGRAERRVTVLPGETFELEYEAPAFMFWTRGRMDERMVAAGVG